MSNERLRAVLLEQGMTPEDLSKKIGVDKKTVERWVNEEGRKPYRRHMYKIAAAVGVDENYLWPGALSRKQVAEASASEVVAVYSHRAEVPRSVWERLFIEAEQEIGILAYAGLFLADDTAIQKLLADKAKAGVRIRILLGDPDSPEVARRGREEGVEPAMAAEVRRALLDYRQLRRMDGVELRLHRTTLYNSIYRADGQLLVNTHIYGIRAPQAPVWHLRKVAGAEIVSMYLDSFDQVWETATPAPEE